MRFCSIYGLVFAKIAVVCGKNHLLSVVYPMDVTITHAAAYITPNISIINVSRETSGYFLKKQYDFEPNA